MNRILKILLITNAVNYISDNLLIPIFVLLINKIEAGIQFAGILYAIQYVTSGIVGVFVIRLKDKAHLDATLLTANYFIKASAWLLLAFHQSIATLILVQILIGFAGAIGSPSFNALVSEHLDRSKHISNWGLSTLTQYIAIAIGSAGSGFIIVHFGFTALFILMSLLEFISFSLCLFLKRQKNM